MMGRLNHDQGQLFYMFRRHTRRAGGKCHCRGALIHPRHARAVILRSFPFVTPL